MSTGILSPLFAGAPAYRARTTWGGISAVAVTVAVFVTAAAAGFAIVHLVAELLGLEAIAFPDESRRATPDGVYGFMIVSQIALQVIVVVLALAVSGLFGNNTREVLALKPARGGAWAYVSSFGLVILVSMALSAVLYVVSPNSMTQDLRPFFGMVTSDFALLFAFAVIVGAPLSEELLFRGFLLSALAQTRLGFLGGAILSTGLWALLHAQYSAAGMVTVVVLGLTFSWILWRTGSLWVTIFCHGLYNALVLLLVYGVATGAVTVAA